MQSISGVVDSTLPIGLSPTVVHRRLNREKMERKQDRREKTEKGQTKNEKKRFTPLDDFFFSWDWSVLRRFSCSVLLPSLSLSLDPCPVVMPLA